MKFLVSTYFAALFFSYSAFGTTIDGGDVEESRFLRIGRGNGGGWRGIGGGGGGGSGGNNGGQQQQQQQPPPLGHGDLIQKLRDHRHLIERNLTLTSTGLTAHTWSDDEQVDTWIKQHVAQMQQYMVEGTHIRQRDPLFVAAFDNAHLIDFDFYTDDDNEASPSTTTDIAKGVFVTETATNPCAIAIIQAHGETVSKFIEFGPQEMRRNHEVPDVCLE